MKLYMYSLYKNTTKNGNSMHYYWLMDAETGCTMYYLLYSLNILKVDKKGKLYGSKQAGQEIKQRLEALGYSVDNIETL